MESLRELDKIAYVRFASVYRDFQDEQAFFNELKNLMRQKLTVSGRTNGPGKLKRFPVTFRCLNIFKIEL